MFLACSIAAVSVQAQAPSGYYDGAIGKTGTELRIALHHIIKGHSALSYGGLWSAYYTTDKKPGTSYVWDIYSDNPGGSTSYHHSLGSDQCSGTSATSENFCYNREHSWPKSKYSSNLPMYTDLWIVYPTDGFVNSKRMDYPYGEVASATYTSSNGSKLGANAYSGAPSTICFEPHDSFKGDIARSYFYVSTRYYSQDGGWANWEMANGADLKPWAKAMLLEWHHLDPVSQKEKDRNNAVQAQQGNRNPFIDHPEMADCIFGTADCSELLSLHETELFKSIQIQPNPAHDMLSITANHLIPEQIYQITVTDIAGRAQDIRPDVQMGKILLPIQNFHSGVYVIQIISKQGNSIARFTKI